MSRSGILLLSVIFLFSVASAQQFASQIIWVQFSGDSVFDYANPDRVSGCFGNSITWKAKPNVLNPELISVGCKHLPGNMNFTNYMFVLKDTPIVPGSNATFITYSHQLTPTCLSTLDQTNVNSFPAIMGDNTGPVSYGVCDASPTPGISKIQWSLGRFSYCNIYHPIVCGDNCYERGNVCCGDQICAGNKCCGPNKCCNSDSKKILSRAQPIIVDL
jgi:hypothetical protein